MDDKEWYIEKKRNEVPSININHKGLMPKCFNCNSSYKMVSPSDEQLKLGFKYKAEHPRGSCPFQVDFCGETSITVISEIRKYNEKKIEARENAQRR